MEQPFDSSLVRAILSISVDRLYSNDFHLLVENAHERSISHKLACYLQEELDQRFLGAWHVDCEYNLNGHDLKKILPLPPRDDPESGQDADRSVYPDIIVHRRGNSDANVLAIEIKKSTSAEGSRFDKLKLSRLVSHLCYNNTLFLMLATGHDAANGDRIIEQEWHSQ